MTKLTLTSLLASAYRKYLLKKEEEAQKERGKELEKEIANLEKEKKDRLERGVQRVAERFKHATLKDGTSLFEGVSDQKIEEFSREYIKKKIEGKRELEKSEREMAALSQEIALSSSAANPPSTSSASSTPIETLGTFNQFSRQKKSLGLEETKRKGVPTAFQAARFVPPATSRRDLPSTSTATHLSEHDNANAKEGKQKKKKKCTVS